MEQSHTHHTKREPSHQPEQEVFSTPQASLGNGARIASHARKIDVGKRDEATIKRFKLQNIARQLLPGKRVAMCLRYLVPNAYTVDVMHVPDGDAAYYQNLRTCDSVWDCPVCATKITERRRVEMMLGVARAHEDGLTPVLVTLTLRHNRADLLADLLRGLKFSYRKFKSGRAWQALKDDFGIVGSVTATEVTHGHGREKNNGWHPHLHALMFLQPISANKLHTLESALKERWEHVLAAQGFDASWEHGLTVKEGDAAIADYVTKWGHEPKETRWTVERELTKAPTKSASDDGATPFQLLELSGAGDDEAGRLFQEYSAVFHGRAQLVWSRGLRNLLGIGAEASDGDIAAADEPTAELLVQLTRTVWWKLMNLPTDVRGELLVIARTGDVPRFEARIVELVGMDVFVRSKAELRGPPMLFPCPICHEDANFLRTFDDPEHGPGREFWCRHCAESVYVLDTEPPADALVPGALSDDSPLRIPAREEAVEIQLGLPVDMPRISD